MRLTALLALAALAVLPHLVEAAPRHVRRAEAIARLSQLGARVEARHLLVDLRGVRFLRHHLDALRELDGVGHLILAGSSVSDPQVVVLSQLPGLTDLDLSGTDVTDAVLDALGRAHGLRSLNLTGTKTTAGAVARFRAAHPDIVVHR